MMISKKSRRNLMIGGVLVAATATPSFALFGLGDIVFDPSSWGELVAQAATAETQLQTIKNNLAHFSFKHLWQTSQTAMKQASVQNHFGETNGMTTALNTNSPSAANMAWTSATVPMSSSTSTYLAGQPQGSAQVSQLALIEASDSTSPDCLNAVGAYRAARTSNATAEADLQQQQLDDSDSTNSEVKQLNLLNASQAQHMTELQAQGVLHACLASEMAVSNMQQRNAAADDLNTAAYIKQRQAITPAFDGGGSTTLTTFLP